MSNKITIILNDPSDYSADFELRLRALNVTIQRTILEVGVIVAMATEDCWEALEQMPEIQWFGQMQAHPSY
jgi:hypothetical protein